MCWRKVPSYVKPSRSAAAREFNSYTVYWAGLAVGNARLTEADSPLYFYNSAQIGFSMYYGNCEPRGGLRDGGCTLPLKITTSFYTAHSDASFGPQRWVHFHGVPAVIYDGGDDIEWLRRPHDVLGPAMPQCEPARGNVHWN